MKRIEVAFSILCVCLAPAAWGQKFTCPPSVNWTEFHTADMMRYNPCETLIGVNNVANLQLKWIFALGAASSSSPVVAGGVVFTGTQSGVLYAVRASDGKLLWSYPTASGGQNNDSPAVANGVVYFGSIDGLVYALNARTGAKLWSYQTGAQVDSPPTVVKGVVYIGSDDGNLYALNASTGALLWSYPTGGWVTCSPAVENGTVYFGSYDGNVYALNASTGALLWSYYVGGNYNSDSSPSPAVANGIVYVGAGDTDEVYALNASTGAYIWSQNIGSGYIPAASPAVAYGMVYFGSGDGDLYAFNAKTGARLWTYGTGNIVRASPAVANGVVYAGTNNWYFFALDANTGAQLWTYGVTYSAQPSPAIVNGMLYFDDNNGTLYALGSGPAVPVVTLSPTSLTFGTQLFGTSSAPQPVTLTNIGGAPLNITRVATSANFSQTNNCPRQVPPGGTCTANVVFTPHRINTITGTIRFTDNASTSPQTVSLTGVGTLASLVPSSLNFTDQLVGTTSAPQTVIFTNYGQRSVSIDGGYFTGSDAGAFAETNTCGTSLPAGGSCTISVTFTPKATRGPKAATLVVVDNGGGPQTVSLTGLATVVTLFPTTLNFGDQTVGTTSQPQIVTLTNQATEALRIVKIQTEGPGRGNFALTNNCGMWVPGGESCTISVTFTPPRTGSETVTLAVYTNGNGRYNSHLGPQTVTLSGTGTQ